MTEIIKCKMSESCDYYKNRSINCNQGEDAFKTCLEYHHVFATLSENEMLLKIKIIEIILFSLLCGMVSIVLLHDILVGNEWYWYCIESISIIGCISTIISSYKTILNRY